MKKITSIIAAIILTIPLVSAQDLPAPSTSAEVKQRIGLTDFTITYSRPSVKGRVIWAGLVPYDELWRTGANKATSIEFSDDIKMNGMAVKAGKYALFTIPGKEEWTIVLNKNTEQWGTGKYNKDEDELRFTAKPKEIGHVETFTIGFSDVVGDKANLNLLWDKVQVSIPIEVDTKEQAIANIKREIEEIVAKPDEDAYRVYNASARYYIDNDIDPKKALEWAKKSTELETKFWNVYTLSLAQAANGMTKQAIASAEKSMSLAKEAEYESYVKFNQENIEKWKKKKK